MSNYQILNGVRYEIDDDDDEYQVVNGVRYEIDDDDDEYQVVNDVRYEIDDDDDEYQVINGVRYEIDDDDDEYQVTNGVRYEVDDDDDEYQVVNGVRYEVDEQRFATRDEYQFEADASGQITGVLEIENGQIEREQIDLNETYEMSGTDVVKTEVERYGVETTVYRDLDSDGFYTKVSQSWVANEGNASTQSRLGWYEVSASASEISFERDEAGTYVVSTPSDTPESLEGLSRLITADKVIGTSDDESVSGGYRLYKAAFDRTPDEEGLGYWINELDQGYALHEVANSFVISEEFKNLYGADLDNSGFITALYNNVLDRDPDQGGLDYWINDMENNGMSRADVLASFSESDENIANTDPLIELGVVYQPYGDAFLA